MIKTEIRKGPDDPFFDGIVEIAFSCNNTEELHKLDQLRVVIMNTEFPRRFNYENSETLVVQVKT